MYILYPFLGGLIVGLLTRSETLNYDGIVPAWIFPLVWSILYILLGISSYLVKNNEELLNIFKINLVINYAWSFIYFTFNMKILAFIWIILLILLTIFMIYKFNKINKFSSYLQIPYLSWLLFTSILNLLEII